MKHTLLFLALGVLGAAAAVCAEDEPPPAWTVVLTDGGCTLAYNGAIVSSASYMSWGPNWKWTGGSYANTAKDLKARAFTGAYDFGGKKVSMKGAVRLEEGRKVVMEFESTSGEALDLTGIALVQEFSLAPAPYARELVFFYPEGKTSPAKIPDEKAGPVVAVADEALKAQPITGWSWEIGGAKIEAHFSEPLKATFEDQRGEDKNRYAIRQFFVGDKKPAGTQKMTITYVLPEGVAVADRIGVGFDPVERSTWFTGAFDWQESPVDLRFLNDHKPGEKGFVKIEGEHFVYPDGTRARFWGTNVAAGALFGKSKEAMAKQAERLAKLGFNLIRIHHQDSAWVGRNIYKKDAATTAEYDLEALDAMDYFIAACIQEGLYIHFDMHVGRTFRPGDNIPGFAEMTAKTRKGEGKGYCFFNERIEELMKGWQQFFWNHENPYLKRAYKDEPGIAATLITNENDLTTHFGNLMLADKGNPHHHAIFSADARAFAEKNGLDPEKTVRTWEPGPSKLYLNWKQTQFFERMREDLRKAGCKVPVTGTNWCYAAYDLPGMACMDFLDTHSYSSEDSLRRDPYYYTTFLSGAAMARVAGKPFFISEWNQTAPKPYRGAAMLQMAAMSALQDWDGPMHYNYWQASFDRAPDRTPEWGSAFDPALVGMSPAAALLYRRADVKPAAKTVAIVLGKDQIYNQRNGDFSLPALRTALDQHRVVTALEKLPDGYAQAETTDGSAYFLKKGARGCVSDTGEVKRDWATGWQSIDTPRTQALQGYIGELGEVKLGAVAFRIKTRFAVVCLQSLTAEPVSASKKLLLSVCARVESDNGRMPFHSEPVRGELDFANGAKGMTCKPLGPKGEARETRTLEAAGGRFKLTLSEKDQTHWFLLEASE
ncbi:MAG: cellulase family glycosylhydrolase [Planctomycetota bacterium]|nr:cellulase family glycosylhydrolase [Planctomycetota bacterium]